MPDHLSSNTETLHVTGLSSMTSNVVDEPATNHAASFTFAAVDMTQVSTLALVPACPVEGCPTNQTCINDRCHLTEGLKVWIPGTNDALDYSGSGNHGKLKHSANTFTTFSTQQQSSSRGISLPPNNALSISLADSSFLSGCSPRTISLRVLGSLYGGAKTHLVSFGDVGVASQGFQLYVSGGNALGFASQDPNNGELESTSTNVFPSSGWRHVAVTVWEQSGVCHVVLYEDGVQSQVGTSTVNVNMINNEVRIGSKDWSARNAMWVADIRIYNRVLSTSEMQVLNAESKFEPTGANAIDLSATVTTATSCSATGFPVQYKARTYVAYLDGVRQPQVAMTLPFAICDILNAAGMSLTEASAGEAVEVIFNGLVPVNGVLRCRFGAGFVSQGLPSQTTNPYAVTCIVPLISANTSSNVQVSVSLDGSSFLSEVSYRVLNKVASILSFADLGVFYQQDHKLMQNDQPIQGIVQVKNPDDLLLFVYTAGVSADPGTLLRSWLSINVTSDQFSGGMVAYGTVNREDFVDNFFSSIGAYVMGTAGTHIGGLAYRLDQNGGSTLSGHQQSVSSSVSWVVLQGAVFHSSPNITFSDTFWVEKPPVYGTWSRVFVDAQLSSSLSHTIVLNEPKVLLSFYKFIGDPVGAGRRLTCTQIIDGVASPRSVYIADTFNSETITCSGFSAARFEPGTHTLEFKLDSVDGDFNATDDKTYMFNVVELSEKDGAQVYEKVLYQAIAHYNVPISQWESVSDLFVTFTLPRARSVLFYYNLVLTKANINVLFRARVNNDLALEAMTGSSAAVGSTTQATWIQRLTSGTYNVTLEYSVTAPAVYVAFRSDQNAACSVLAIVLPETTVMDVVPSIVHTGYVGSITVRLNSTARAELGASRCMFNNTFTSTVTSIDSAANAVTCAVPFVLTPGNLSVEVSLDGFSYSMDSNVSLVVMHPSVSISLTSSPNVTHKYDPSVHTVNIHATISGVPATYSSDDYRSTWSFSGDDSNFHYLTSKHNSTDIVIAPNSFPAGNVGFTFSYADARGITAVQTIAIDINSPPTGGTFVCSPTSGVAFDTIFSLTMASWTDADGGLSYAFALLSANSAHEVLLRSASALASISIPLPSGSATKGYTVTLVGYIYDVYGMATRVTTNVTVNGASVSQSVIQDKVQTLQSSVQLMSTSDALQTIAVLGTTMLEVWTDRAAARINFDIVFSVMLNVSSGMSSADAIQALDTVRLLTSVPPLLTNDSQITASSILNSTLVFAASFPYAVNPSTVLDTVSNIASAVELTAAETNSSAVYQSSVYSALVISVDTLVQIVGSTLVSHQSSATSSSKANLTIEYAPASSLVSRNLTSSSSGSSFTAYIPQAIFAGQALASTSTPVFSVLLEFDFNPYSNASGSTNLTSSTTELTFYSDLSTSTQTSLAIQGLSPSSPILLYIPLTNNTNTSSVSCQFLNTALNVWQTSGCSVHAVNNDTCVCACTHTTVFAVAGSVWSNSNIGVIDNFDKIGNILSAVGLYVFAVALVLYIALVSWGRKKDQQEWQKLRIHDDDSDAEDAPSMFQMLREHFCAGSKNRSEQYAAPSATRANRKPEPQTAYNASGKLDRSTSHVAPRPGFKFASPEGSPRVEIKHAASSRHVTLIKSDDPEIGEDEDPFLPVKVARSPRGAHVEEASLPHSLKQLSLLAPDCISRAATSRSIDLSVGNETPRSLEESESTNLIQVPSSTADGNFEHPLKRKMTLKRVIAHVKEEHLLLSVIFYTKKEFSRPARVTLYFCVVLSHLVAAALFYNADEDPCGGDPLCSDDVGFFDGVAEFGWADFWVSVYSILITIPINLALMYLFKSKRIMPGSSAAKRARIVKSNLQRRRIAYTVSAMFASFCAFYLVMFTLSFNIRVSYRWITSWAVATVQDFAVWENAGILSRVMLIRYVLGPLFLYRMVELSYKRRQARRVVAAPHATSK
eukprot:GILJ01003503.1.p1 GENE.GILJ01003503.1~~GILJ01003503.1.p1  ORF type:complete len:2040 (+),score=227.83 GILJ01003503.1:289-6120(+)